MADELVGVLCLDAVAIKDRGWEVEVEGNDDAGLAPYGRGQYMTIAGVRKLQGQERAAKALGKNIRIELAA